MPTPGESGYGQALEESLIDLTLASDGRALALFTSHGALRAAARGVRGPLEDAGIVVLAQGLDGSPARVLNALRENPRSLVLGTASLWEGVDVPRRHGLAPRHRPAPLRRAHQPRLRRPLRRV